MTVHCDLHIHSALSPCGEERMTPNNIVNMALVAGLELIAVTDHNTCGNCRAVIEAGRRAGLAVAAGMELTTAEEAHIVCLFPTADAAELFEKHEVAERRMHITNDPEVFGHQYRMDADDNIVGEEEELLIPATEIGSHEVQALCRRYGGAAIPAHIDKHSYSVLSSLGYLDPEMGFAVCEVTPSCDTERLISDHPELSGVSWVRNSDAHDLGPIGISEQTLELEEATAEALIRFLSDGIGGAR